MEIRVGDVNVIDDQRFSLIVSADEVDAEYIEFCMMKLPFTPSVISM